ncbi:RHS repeat-associated core domain-containing protein [Motilimonas pumila]|nr:RHS repeat-associated core domain-containing protein [Motilimonas pumila]
MKRTRAVDVVKKIQKILKLVKADTQGNIGILRKPAHSGVNGHAIHLNKTQPVNGNKLEGATSQKRSGGANGRIEVIEANNKHNQATTNQAEKKTQSADDTKTSGCPISMVTGEELLKVDDGHLPGIIEFDFKRLYKSSSIETDLGFGPGWSHPFVQNLVFEDGNVSWFDAENNQTQFPEPTQQSPSVHNPMAKSAIYLGSSENEYILSQSNGMFCHFERKGDFARLTGFSDQYGNRLTLTYDALKRPLALTNEQNISLTLGYNEQHNITQLAIKQLTPGSDQWQTLKILQRYQYNDAGQLVANANPLGEGEQYQYHANHLIKQRTLAGGAAFFWQWQGEDKHARAIKHWSNTGFEATYDWDDEAGQVTVTHANGSTEVYQHNEDAKLVLQQDPDGAQTHYQYNEDGQITAQVDPLGGITEYHYDSNGALAAKVSPDGQATQYQFVRGNLRTVSQGKARWRFKHNAQGSVTEQITPLGQSTQYQYDKQGLLTDIQYPDNTKHQFSWNKLGQLINENLPQGGQIRYRYDALGRQILRQEANGAITQFEWDDANRLSKIVLPNKSSRQYQYNAYGKITLETDEHGHQTRYDYHDNLHLVSQRTQPDGSFLRYQYDNPQRFVSQISNEKGEQYFIHYYPNGLVKREVGFDGIASEYEYDLQGNLTVKRHIGLAGTILETRFERDIMGRLMTKTLPDGQVIAFQYDTQGRLVGVDDGERPLYWQYDIMGQLTEEHQGWASQFYDYDELGQIKRWQLPDAQQVDYQYQQGQLAGISLNGQVLTQHVFQHGLETRRTQGGLTSEYQYDEQGRLTAHSQQQHTLSKGNASQLKQQRHYQYDAAGQLTHLSDSVKGDKHYEYDPLARLAAVRGNIEEHFQHDPAGHLLAQTLGPKANHSSHTQQATQQVTGNRLAFQGDCHFEYDEFGNLIKEKRGKNQQLVTHYHYDCQHRLIKANMPNGAVAQYQYDAFGRRYAKTVNQPNQAAVETEFIWQADRLIAETDHQGHYQSYLYEPGTFKPLALIKGEANTSDSDATPDVFYYQLDHLGTPQEITDALGHTVWSVQYRAYGNVLKQEVEEIHSPLRFQGQYYDVETGLHYNRHRYYNPNTAAFLTLDPIGLAGGLNNYQYVPNPTGWIDPLGLANKKGDELCCEGDVSTSSKPLPEPKAPTVKFRALTESQAKDALNGKDIQPKDINADYSIQQHVDDGSLNTQYNSLGSKRAAKRYARANPKRGKLKKSVIIEVDTSKIELSRVHDILKGIDPSTGKALDDPAYRYARKDKEVLIEGSIPSNSYKVVE